VAGSSIGERGACRLIIGVAGGSGSGKSLFARSLAERLRPRPAVLISEDDYYRRQTPGTDPTNFDFDAPSARDHAHLAAHLGQLRDGQAIARPIYSFRIHAPLKRTVAVPPTEVVIVEGLHVLHDAQVRGLLDFSVFLDVDDDVRFIRRLLRDTRERGRSVRSVVDQYLSTVKPAHDAYVGPTKALADLVLTTRSDGCSNDDERLAHWLAQTLAALAARSL
jgi:uridine kinase